MFIVQESGNDISSHTKYEDAVTQRQRLIDRGVDENALVIVEKETFAPIMERIR